MKRKPLPDKQATKAAGWRWWQGMLFGILLMVSPGGLLLLMALSAPVLLCLVCETARGRPLTRTVTIFTLAGAIEPVRSFLFSSHTLADSVDVLARIGSLPLTWTGAAAGWLVNEASCVAAVWMTDLRLAGRRREIEARLAALRTEWSLPATDP